jgi:hypothetical protein
MAWVACLILYLSRKGVSVLDKTLFRFKWSCNATNLMLTLEALNEDCRMQIADLRSFCSISDTSTFIIPLFDILQSVPETPNSSHRRQEALFSARPIGTSL